MAVKKLSALVFFFLLICVNSLFSRSMISDSTFVAPAFTTARGIGYCTAMHDVGRISLLMTNGGMIGTGDFTPAYGVGPTPYSADSSGCHLGRVIQGSDLWAGEYPMGSQNKCLHVGSLWVGGVTDRGDTLVSVGYWSHFTTSMSYEFYPDLSPQGRILENSLLDPATASIARSDQDYVATYTDTFLQGLPGLQTDWRTHKRHQPLGIQVVQTSSQWSNPLVDNFILIEYKISNIGRQNLHDVYAGIFVDPAHASLDRLENDNGNQGEITEISGYLDTLPSAQGCGFVDTLGIAWAASPSGYPADMEGTPRWVESGAYHSVRTVTGVRILQAPKGAYRPSFNWWVPETNPAFDYGPRHKPPNGQNPHNFGTGGTGTPMGDADKYYVMSNGEVDPDQERIVEIQPDDPVWEYPQAMERRGAYSQTVHIVLSAGPFELQPGDEKSLVIAYVAGDNFHQDPSNYRRLQVGDVDGWYSHVDFSDLAKNANMAAWVFDNPGVDTDGDGYAGKFRVCLLDSALVNGHWTPTAAETTYYAGDGVPDWRAVGPPPAPKFWLSQSYRGIHVRFNGKNSETTKDLVTNKIDFEGYRIYCGLDDREGSLAMVASYDLQDYDKYAFNPKVYPNGAWQAKDYPFTLQKLKCLYGSGADPCHDPLFDPLRYTQGFPLRLSRMPDSQFYFVPHDYNASEFGKTTQITKIYPDAKLPAPDSITAKDLTPDGFLKYYEYQFTIPNLLPTMQYYVNVTAFDFGDPAKGVAPLESSKMLGIKTGYPLADSNQLGAELPPVYEYPNPYFGDGRYRANGYEGRTSDASDDRVRKIHFVNVPAKCTVRVLTLDGDIVTEIHHDMDPSDANAHHETWDMISRNRETIVSGLYYWAVEGADGKVQIGKFVVIR